MNAIISVYNKTGVAAFAKALHERGIALIATGGTARELEKSGIPVKKVADFTGSPELLGGQVKTLHPRIHAAIATGEIGMVVVNLIPPGDGTENLLDTMDIGGVALIRAGIKHFEKVTVIVNPERYTEIIAALNKGGRIAQETKLQLAREALRYLIAYDSQIEALLAQI
jgi:phosphoribosylaminoimidazolecarboxamide formyltransferase/IMP cyclohydrolase